MKACLNKAVTTFHDYSIWGQAAVLLAIRLWIAKVFFYSGLSKLPSWETTIALFEEEYKVPLLPPELAAYMATGAELALPVLLVLGLLTRFAALGLFGMTLVIELLVYPGTTEHYYWMLTIGTLMAFGGGKLAADAFVLKRLGL